MLKISQALRSEMVKAVSQLVSSDKDGMKLVDVISQVLSKGKIKRDKTTKEYELTFIKVDKFIETLEKLTFDRINKQGSKAQYNFKASSLLNKLSYGLHNDKYDNLDKDKKLEVKKFINDQIKNENLVNGKTFLNGYYYSISKGGKQ